MILNIYAFKDNKMRCYTQPFYNDVPEENVKVGIIRAIQGNPEKSGLYKGKVLSRLGIFDDTTGKIEPCEPVYILDCDEVIASLDYGKDNA